MADAVYSGAAGDGGLRATSLNAPVNLIGAVLSVSLIVGLSVWGYQLAVRDVSGVPVVRALEGPMRIRPEEPGGRPAEFQGLSVNQIPAEGMAGPAPDALILAPSPVQISDADVVEPAPLPTATATDLAVAAALSGIDLTEVEDTVAEAPAPVVQTYEIVPASLPGVSRSPRPEPRPRVVAAIGASLQSQDATASTATTALAGSVTVIDVDPSEVEPGTRLVQLGAFDSLEEAQKEWDEFAKPFAEYFDGRQRVIQEAASGGRTFYRLRVLGFTDLADARRFCSVLLAKDAPCIPVVAR